MHDERPVAFHKVTNFLNKIIIRTSLFISVHGGYHPPFQYQIIA